MIVALIAVIFDITKYYRIAIAISMLSMIVICISTLNIMVLNGFRFIGVAAVIYVCTQHWIYRFFPLETILTLSLNVTAIALAMNRRWISAGLIAGLSIVARPDSVLVFFIIAIFFYIENRDKAIIKYLLAGTVTASFWYIPAWIYYGSPFPNTLSAKSGYAWLTFINAIWPKILSNLFFENHIGSGIVIALAIIGVIYCIWSKSRLLIFPVWGAIHSLGYTALRISYPYSWYYLPLIYITIILACVGISATFRVLSIAYRQYFRKIKVFNYFVYAIFGIALMIGFYFSSLDTIAFIREYHTNYFAGAREHVYKDVANWIVRNSNPDETIAIAEIGSVGFYSERYIIDFYGLASYKLRDLNKTENWIDAILQTNPDYIITVRNLPPDPQMKGINLPNYKIVKTFPRNGTTNLFEDIIIYKRTLNSS
jgi:hypothetical protein